MLSSSAVATLSFALAAVVTRLQPLQASGSSTVISLCDCQCDAKGDSIRRKAKYEEFSGALRAIWGDAEFEPFHFHMVVIVLCLGLFSGACAQAWESRQSPTDDAAIQSCAVNKPELAWGFAEEVLLSNHSDAIASSASASWLSAGVSSQLLATGNDTMFNGAVGSACSQVEADRCAGASEDTGHLDSTAGPQHCMQASHGSRMSPCSNRKSPEHFFIFDEEDLPGFSKTPSPCQPGSPSAWSMSLDGLANQEVANQEDSAIPSFLDRSAGMGGALPSDCSIFVDGSDGSAADVIWMWSRFESKSTSRVPAQLC